MDGRLAGWMGPGGIQWAPLGSDFPEFSEWVPRENLKGVSVYLIVCLDFVS